MSKVPQQRNALASFADYMRKIFPHMSQRDAEESAKMSGPATRRAAFLGGWKAGWIARKWHEHNKMAKDMASYSPTELFVLDHFESIVAALDSKKYDSVLRQFAKHKERLRLQEMVRKFEGLEPESYAAFSGLFTQAYGATAGEEVMIATGADSENLVLAAHKAFDVIDAKKAAKAAGREKYGTMNFARDVDSIRVHIPVSISDKGLELGKARFFVADTDGKYRETISEAQAAAAMERFNNPPKSPRKVIDKFLGEAADKRVAIYTLGVAVDKLTEHGHTITPLAVAKLSKIIPEIRHLFVDSMLKQRKPSTINTQTLRGWLKENVGRKS